MTLFQAESFFIDPYSRDRFRFQANPTTINERRGVKLKQVAIPGRERPRLVPSNGTSREISFQLVFVALSEEDENPQWVKRQYNYLMSLTYPRVVNESTGRRAITPVFMVIGSFYQLPVYIKSVNPVHGPFRNPSEMEVIASKLPSKWWRWAMTTSSLTRSLLGEV